MHGVGTGWVPGWGMGLGGYWEGYTGVLPSARKEVPNQRSGPRKPLLGAGVGGLGTGCVRAPDTTHSGPLVLRGPLRCIWASPRANAASQPIRARFDLISWKLSQNRVVSPKMSEKACHSPYSQNAAQKSPLEFLRFPYFLAFSHKELMVPF